MFLLLSFKIAPEPKIEKFICGTIVLILTTKKMERKIKIEKDFIKKIYTLTAIIALIFAYTLIVSKSTNIIGKTVKVSEEVYPIVYRTAPFDWILPHSTPGPDTNNINIFASPGEYEPATFAVYTDVTLLNVKVDVSDLISSNGIIPHNNIDVRIVKVWNQSGLDIARTLDVYEVPELLVYDD